MILRVTLVELAKEEIVGPIRDALAATKDK